MTAPLYHDVCLRFVIEHAEIVQYYGLLVECGNANNLHGTFNLHRTIYSSHSE